MSIRRTARQPAILSRKRKAEREILILSPESSPSTSGQTTCSEGSPMSDVDIHSSDENKSPNPALSPSIVNHFRGIAIFSTAFSCNRASPFPELEWAEQKELWNSMLAKDLIYRRNPRVMSSHPDLEPHMRAILLDWLTEVCEVYRLHRETYYLAVDYIDRYLCAKPNLPKNCLQLLGATALFIASKMEEIYPPKLSSFAFVTDGACTEEQILAQELILLMELNWNLSPITINGWLNIFLQLAYVENAENLTGPEQFPKPLLVQMFRVMDLCILDTESLRYPYSVLCASVIAHFISKETAMHVSGLQWSELSPCVAWLKPFVQVCDDGTEAEIKFFHDIPIEECYNIQTHSITLKHLDKIYEKQRAVVNETSPSFVLRELTPPQSHRKKAKLDK